MARKKDIKISHQKLKTGVNLSSGTYYKLCVGPVEYIRLEFHDLLYHHNSAVLLPDSPMESSSQEPDQESSWEDPEILGKCKDSHPDTYDCYESGGNGSGDDGDTHDTIDTFSILAAIFKFLENNKDYSLLVAGHADTSGEDEYNFKISEMRAQSVLYLLEEKREEWAKLCKDKSKTEDYQYILAYITTKWGWNCDPGPVDNIKGTKTKQAVLEFQKAYNSHFSQNILEDGEVGMQTWRAFYDMYIWQLTLALEKDPANYTLPPLRFVDDNVPYIACGEKLPTDEVGKDDYRSQENRRVEILFFNKDELPDLSCHKDTSPYCMKNCTRDKCNVYSKTRYRPVVLDPGMVDYIIFTNADEGKCEVCDCETPGENLYGESDDDNNAEIAYVDCGTEEDECSEWAFLEEIPDKHTPYPVTDADEYCEGSGGMGLA